MKLYSENRIVIDVGNCLHLLNSDITKMQVTVLKTVIQFRKRFISFTHFRKERRNGVTAQLHKVHFLNPLPGGLARMAGACPA